MIGISQIYVGGPRESDREVQEEIRRGLESFLRIFDMGNMRIESTCFSLDLSGSYLNF